jgi:integrase
LIETPTNKSEGFLKHDTIYRSISNVRAFYKWAVARHLAHDNPARKVIVEKNNDEDDDDKRDPYSVADLTRIFSAPLYTGCKSVNRIMESGAVLVRDHRFWFPLVALHSGMRLSEIAQLEFSDIVVLNGRKHFSVNRQSHHGNKKTTKTKSSIRQIPVHPKLIELGFLAWVEQRRKASANGRIFVDYRYGNWWNQVFTVDVGVKTDRLVFHSFRHNMADALRDATESDETRDRFMGHWRSSTGKLYGGRDLTKSESHVIDRVVYAGLDLSHLMPT